MATAGALIATLVVKDAGVIGELSLEERWRAEKLTGTELLVAWLPLGSILFVVTRAANRHER